MLLRAVRHDWRNLAADRTAVVVLLIFAVVIGYGLFRGHAWARHQQATLAQMEQDERERLGEIGRLITEEERKAVAEGKPLAYPAWGPRHPAYVGIYRGQRYAALPPAPLAPLAVGQTDVLANYFKVSAGMKESFLIAQETESPFKLLAGQFDLAFVIIYFYPLLILALTFNLVASEREDGTLRMLLSNSVRLRSIVLGKVAGVRGRHPFARQSRRHHALSRPLPGNCPITPGSSRCEGRRSCGGARRRSSSRVGCPAWPRPVSGGARRTPRILLAIPTSR